jgi:hypothetical protein
MRTHIEHRRPAMKIWIVVALLVTCGGPSVRAAEPLVLNDRLIYVMTNLATDQNVDKLGDLFARAHQAGYTGAVLTDSKFGNLPAMDAHYFANIKKLKAVAAAQQLEIIPCVFPSGWANGMLAQNPNLAEGLPVKDALFVVSDGEARLQADPPVALRGGDMTNLKRWDFHDDTVTEDNGTARFTFAGGNARIVQKVKVHPFRQYHLALKLKSQNARGPLEAKVLVDDHGELRDLAFASLGMKATQEWNTHHVVFNSLDHEQVGLYIGSWGNPSGTVWMKDVTLEEVGLLNVLRRDGTPLTVKAEDGKELKEGVDFEPVADKRMGNVPWKGEYEVYHQSPVIRTHLPDGAKLRVSYYHPMVIGDGSVAICPSDPGTIGLQRDQAKRMHAAWGAKGYFMEHDEMRIMNWDESCQRKHLDAGGILAENVRTCIGILKEVNPGGRIYVWSDMFDPNHNAVNHYYLVRGNLANSWDGLSKDVIIALWYREKRDASMAFFAARGNPMLIAGYYDSPVSNMRQWLDSAGKAKGVEGTMYTTWQDNYTDLEGFERVVEEYRRGK